MPWLTGARLRIESHLPPKAARTAFESCTVRFWTHSVFSEACVGIVLGKFVLAWRTPWRRFAFIPGPVFRGTLRSSPSGSVLSGCFTLPLLTLVMAAGLLGLAAYGGLTIVGEFHDEPGLLSIALLAWLIMCVPIAFVARWILKLPWVFSNRDQSLVERSLCEALKPAA